MERLAKIPVRSPFCCLLLLARCVGGASYVSSHVVSCRRLGFVVVHGCGCCFVQHVDGSGFSLDEFMAFSFAVLENAGGIAKVVSMSQDRDGLSPGTSVRPVCPCLLAPCRVACFRCFSLYTCWMHDRLVLRAGLFVGFLLFSPRLACAYLYCSGADSSHRRCVGTQHSTPPDEHCVSCLRRGW